MEKDPEKLLLNAIQFLFLYIKFKSIHPELLPVFCQHMPDDEFLIRVMLKNTGLEEFIEEFNQGAYENVLKAFYKVIKEIESDYNYSLKSWCDEDMIVN